VLILITNVSFHENFGPNGMVSAITEIRSFDPFLSGQLKDSDCDIMCVVAQWMFRIPIIFVHLSGAFEFVLGSSLFRATRIATSSF
jgi:hypothetical protein